MHPTTGKQNSVACMVSLLCFEPRCCFGENFMMKFHSFKLSFDIWHKSRRCVISHIFLLCEKKKKSNLTILRINIHDFITGLKTCLLAIDLAVWTVDSKCWICSWKQYSTYDIESYRTALLKMTNITCLCLVERLMSCNCLCRSYDLCRDVKKADIINVVTNSYK